MRHALAVCLLVLVLVAPADAARPVGNPTNKALPTVVGALRLGEQVTGSSGIWSGSGTIAYSYVWNRCDALGSGCTAISGAALPTYRLTAADLGKTLGLTVTAKDSAGTATAYASLVGPVAAQGALASIGRPVVTGTAKVGSTLTASVGVWTAAPSAVTYSWLRCDNTGRACAAIAGATSSTDVPGAADAGHTLVARVQATAGTSTQVTFSLATAAVTGGTPTTTTTTTTTSQTTTAPTTTTTTTAPAPQPGASTRPTVTGTAKVGQRLTGSARPGTTGTLAYQWYRCDATGAHCNSIHGAVAAKYVLVAKDAGKTIGLTVKVTPSGGTTAPSYASLVGPVATAAASTVQPAVIGKPLQGQTLTASAGTWTATPSSVAYAWQRCNPNGRICTPISGATNATYAPIDADVGHALVALVTATLGSAAQAVLSAATDAIQAPPPLAPTAPLAVAGTAQVGQRLTGAAGTWTGTEPIAFHYQWYRCDAAGAHCASVHGATAATYRLVAKDAGKTIGLTVTATDGDGTKQAAYASLVGPVAASSATLAPTAQPTLTGSAVQGQTLAVVAGSWNKAPATTTYAWERCNANGRLCTPIAGATATTYAITSADVGHALVAVATVHAGSATATAFSTASSAAKA